MKRRRGPYKLYNKDPTLSLPKVSAWRRRREVEETILAADRSSIDEEGISHSWYILSVYI